MSKVTGYFWLLKEEESPETVTMFLEQPTYGNMISDDGTYWTDPQWNKMVSEERNIQRHTDLLLWEPLNKWADCSNSNCGFKISINAFSHEVIESLKVNKPKEFDFTESKS